MTKKKRDTVITILFVVFVLFFIVVLIEKSTTRRMQAQAKIIAIRTTPQRAATRAGVGEGIIIKATPIELSQQIKP